jgi:O-antigen ligase
MLKENIYERVINLEWYALLLCIFSIPLFESPKIIFLVISGVFFLTRRYIEKDYKSAFLKADPRLGFLALFAAATLSAIFAQKPLLAFDGGLDFVKMYLVFVIVSTDFTDKRSLTSIGLAIIISTAIASVWGIADYAAGKIGSIELRSVGHVNHSAIYIALVLLVSLAMISNLFDNKAERILIFPSTVILWIAFILASARASILGLTVAIVGMAAFVGRKKQLAYILTIGLIIGLIVLFSMPNTQILKKDYSLSVDSVSAGVDAVSVRIVLWKKSWDIFTKYPLFGVGAKHFRFYSALDYGSHAHSLYFNIIAQLGAVGFIALIILFYSILKMLINFYNKNFLWTAALGAFIIVAINGIFNTTLHSEHGLLFAVILGMAQRRETLEI